jgi:hypothetical protein
MRSLGIKNRLTLAERPIKVAKNLCEVFIGNRESRQASY